MKKELLTIDFNFIKVGKNTKPILILMFALFSMAVFGQPTGDENEEKKSTNNYLPIIKSGQIWSGYSYEIMYPIRSFRYSYSEDSVMMGDKYYFARNQSIKEDGSNSFVRGYFREQEGKLLRYKEGSGEEETILDMNLNLDETITFDYDDYQVSLKAINVDSVQFADNVWRKRIELNCLENPSWFGSTTWIEGIGELISYEPHCAVDNGDGEIVCVRNDLGELIYNNVDEDKCWITTSTKDMDIVSTQIFPNPVVDELEIKGLSGEVNYNIYSASGQIILSSKTKNNRIWVYQLQNGMYLLELWNGDRRVSTRFVKL